LTDVEVEHCGSGDTRHDGTGEFDTGTALFKEAHSPEGRLKSKEAAPAKHHAMDIGQQCHWSQHIRLEGAGGGASNVHTTDADALA
jgi:hypothetical protein